MDDFGTQEPSRRRLGRGLNALLGMAPTGPSTEAEPGTSSTISVDLIDRNPFQPRHEFDPAALCRAVGFIYCV